MKRLFSLMLMSAILIVAMSASPIKNAPIKSSTVKSHIKKASADIYLANGTAWYSSANIGGNIYTEPPEDCSEVGSLNTGTYSITLSTTAPGSHQYVIPGQTTQVNSTGSATFPSVTISGDITVSVY